MVGDGGNAAEGETPPVLQFLKEELKSAPGNSSLIFLGDNIYPDGFPKKGDESRKLAEHRLQVQITPANNFPGKVLFIPGNHDWYEFGIDGLKRQRHFLESALDRKNVWLPKPGCGGPEVVEVHENLVYIIIDSQWWLTNWNKHPGINEGCEATNRTDFMRLFKDAIKGNKEKNIVVVMHHPMETYGRHGGHFTAKDHLLPVPIIGSVVPFLRANVGSLQDNVNASFQDLRKGLLSHVKLNGNATFISGHEHNLQYIEKDNQRYIVSGAASKIAPAGLGEGSKFAYGGRGYSVLDLYEDGSLWVTFYTVDDQGSKKRLLYRKQIQEPRAADSYVAPDSYEKYPLETSSVECKLVHQDYNRSAFGRFILGDHYRKSFNVDLKLDFLDLNTFKGGLEPLKKGGGNQTQSIRLEAANGRQFAMRSLAKDPSATLGYELGQSSAVQKLVEDAFTAAHPLSALPVVGLAEAAGVLHTNPAVYYVPSQPALGKYNPQFGGKAYLVEERPDDKLWKDEPFFGNAEDIVSTSKALEEMRKHQDHLLDVPAMARARAFDILLNDWDRHDDQWRWAVHQRDGNTYYSPIPRDRDQAFSHYDGVLLGLARLLSVETRPLAPFKSDPSAIKWATHGNRFFDATFLAEVDWATWEKETRHLQTMITDEVIERSFKEGWPPEILAVDGAQIIATLKGRRDNLMNIIRDLYEFRAKTVEVTATDKRDFFSIDVQKNGDVLLRVFDVDKKGDKKGEAFYERLFLKSETKNVILYGLDGKDHFHFSGGNKPGMRFRIVGGPGKDMVDVEGTKGLSKVHYYDYLEEEESSDLSKAKGLHDRRSTDVNLNTYSRLSLDKNYDFLSILPVIGSNPDNGLLLGGSVSLTKYGFKKEPFASQHLISGLFATQTKGVKVGYLGEFTDVFGSNELVIEAEAHSSLYGVNFYGFGNETLNEEEELGLDFNRVRKQNIMVSPQFKRKLGSASAVYIGPSYSTVQTDRTEDRFLAVNSEDLDEEGIFSNYTYLGLNARLEFDNRNSGAYPTRGVRFHAEANYALSIEGPGASFPTINTYLTLNQQLDRLGKIVIANRIGYTQAFSKDITYFQAATLGGVGADSNMRGFRRERFSGERAFWVNTDLRVKLFNSNQGKIPFSFGVLGGFDVGRVYLSSETSDVWHYSYGGGVFISPFDLATIKVSYFLGDGEIGRLLFGAGFFF
jgi:hypothetical protein